jgi:hypothetical protein
MGILTSGKRRIIIVAVVAISIIFVGVAYQILNNSGTNADQTEKGSKFSNNGLQAASRQQLTICVDNYSSDKSSELSGDILISKIEKQLPDLKQKKRWVESGYNAFTVDVKETCSFKPILLEPNAKHPIYSGNEDSTRIVEEASPELIGVFVVDKSVIDKHFTGAPDRWAPEQLLCEGEECNEVTKGIYLTPDELKAKDLKELYKEMAHALGLEG